MSAAILKTGSMLLRMVDALARVRISFDFLAPEGYEDENGFHYGVQPAPKQISRPQAD